MKKTNHLSLQAIFFLFTFRIIFSQNIQPDYSDIEYALVGHISLTLDVYLPKNVPAPYPVIIWIHGGSWLVGSKENPNGLDLVSKGYALVSINYRLSVTATYHATYPAQIYDCKAAIRWIRANSSKYNFDPLRIGAYGSSAGGHLVALLGTTNGSAVHEGTVGGNTQYSSSVQAVCDWYGPADLITTCIIRGVDVCIPLSPVWDLLGGSVSKNMDLAKSASPVYQVTKDDSPFLIMHGTLDPIVPIEQSVELDSVLRKNNVPVIFKRIVGAGHGGGGFDSVSSKIAVADFFDKFLKSITTIGFETVTANDFKLFQNYPNPFNPSTVINYQLPVVSKVSLKIFDVLGREVKNLVDEEKTPGSYKVEFNGNGLVSGVYFYQLRTGKYVETKKFVLTK